MKDIKKPVWKKPKPRAKKAVKLTKAQIQEAKERAAKAGRKYPNLIDNMFVAQKAKLFISDTQ